MRLLSKNSNNPYLHNYYWSEAVLPGRAPPALGAAGAVPARAGRAGPQSESAARGDLTCAPPSLTWDVPRTS